MVSKLAEVSSSAGDMRFDDARGSGMGGFGKEDLAGE